jgi:cell division protein FtsL
VDSFFGAGGGLVLVLFSIALIVLAILWIFLPFAVFGVKSRLDKLLFETQRTNALLESLILKQSAASARSESQDSATKHVGTT